MHAGLRFSSAGKVGAVWMCIGVGWLGLACIAVVWNFPKTGIVCGV